jgi:hypothetical protein
MRANQDFHGCECESEGSPLVGGGVHMAQCDIRLLGLESCRLEPQPGHCVSADTLEKSLSPSDNFSKVSHKIFAPNSD